LPDIVPSLIASVWSNDGDSAGIGVNPRSAYIRVVRSVRTVAERTGTLTAMQGSARPWVRYLRTLLSIYDVEDQASLDIPWWTYRAIREVEGFLAARDDARVFEYGSGASTVWLSRRADFVHSVEHDPDFARRMRLLLDGVDNVALHEVPPRPAQDREQIITSGRSGHQGLDFREYVETIDRVGGRFDLVVVDGRARVACLSQALARLTPGGMVLLDDARRRRYRPAWKVNGAEFSVLAGAKPCVPYRDATAIARVAQR
jgi:hypothetical protein